MPPAQQQSPRFNRVRKLIFSSFWCLGLVCTSLQSSYAALPELTLCGFTLMGENGPEYQALKDYQLAAIEWGAKLDIKTYMNEDVIASELKAGVCDMATLTSAGIHHFNSFTATIGAIGALPDYEHLKILLATLNKPKAGSYLQNNGYEIIGIQPVGGIYLFLNDRYVKSIADLAGRKVGVLENFPEMHELVSSMGMTPVSSTVSNIFQKFNNGSIDITGGPAVVYELMELHKGLKDTGGIIEAPLLQSTIQVVAKQDKLPPGFAEKSRQYVLDHFEESMTFIRQAEARIPRKYRIPLPDCNRREFDELNRKIRLQLRDKGSYHPKMLTLMRRVRCKVDGKRPECTDRAAE